MAKSFEIKNLSEFNSSLKRILKENKSKRRAILTKVAMDGLRQLQAATPKDTSRAAASWTNTVDSPPTEWFQPEGKKFYPLPPFKDQRKITAESVINLSNNIIYIIPLEKGHSKKRKYFVRDTVAALTIQLTKEAKKESRRNVK